MNTDWTSLLPFLAALKRQPGTPSRDGDSDPSADESDGGGAVLGSSQTNGGADALSQGNLMGDTAPRVAQGDSTLQNKGQLLVQLLQSGLQGSNPNQAQQSPAAAYATGAATSPAYATVFNQQADPFNGMNSSYNAYEESPSQQSAPGAGAAPAQAGQGELVMVPTKWADTRLGKPGREQDVEYQVKSMDSHGNLTPDEAVHKLELREIMIYDKNYDRSKGPTPYCKNAGQCGANASDHLRDHMGVNGRNTHGVEKRFFIDDKRARVYDPTTKKAYDLVRVDASVKSGFVFTYQNEPAK